ncbi:MAG: hypothetical protein AAB224_08315 [Gemmatimonadota bacterium]
MPWFRRIGWFHVPVSVPGVIVTVVALAFCAQVFWATDRNSHSVTDTLYRAYPFIIPTLLLLDWVASRTTAPQGTRR